MSALPLATAGSALLIDAAGTLLRPAESVARTYARLAARHCEIDEHAVAERLPGIMQRARALRAAQPDWRPYWAEVVRVSTGCDSPALLDALLEHFTRAEAWRVTEGAERCARAVAERGMKVAVVSNWDVRLRATLEALGVSSWIDAAIISAEVGVEKPHPEIFHRACERLGVRADRALHVGDDHHDDVDGARAAGCLALLWPAEVGSFDALAQRLLGDEPSQP
ncbi:HAD-IA family hydrolase [Paraliomyxa miuraensis]|uniref:HAD-IA family hydrolase n=1 Tax=Paraliomyxa miuraensis TaxID=376150 RepID=UPI00225A8176|nr:HAD-IA family hydrolase [Paraliomyxa miuraensis]MCX4247776.1 HAD-IA family hydrolase [Paraliomyxa miuraensis]